jgi:hypothetical protein
MTLVYEVIFLVEKLRHVPCASHTVHLAAGTVQWNTWQCKNKPDSFFTSLSKCVSCYVYVTRVNYTAIWSIDRGTAAALEEKLIPVALCPPQIPYGLNWNETRDSAVRGPWRHDSLSHSHQTEWALTWQSFIHVKHILTTTWLQPTTYPESRSCALNISVTPTPSPHRTRFISVL